MHALGGTVFDVRGEVTYEGESLRQPIEAIRLGDRPDVRTWMIRVIDEAPGGGSAGRAWPDVIGRSALSSHVM
jgi:hypothetical protein